jgi:hypothetical protein
MNISFNGRANPDTCAHADSITVNTVGVQRVICETCGHVSVNFIDDLGGEVSRTAFAREADQLRSVKHLVGASV